MECIRKRSRFSKRFTTKDGVNKIITIDGPAASGKTSIGYKFSQSINFNFLDAGTVYRAGCVRLLDLGCPINDDVFNREVYKQVVQELQITNNIDGQLVNLGGKDITERLNIEETTRIVSQVGSKPLVRGVVRDLQREISQNSNCVFTGRDVGTEVFPDSNLKLYLTAVPEVRAKRRYLQLIEEGKSADFEEILTNIIFRDNADSNRSYSPFSVPLDAVIIDTSDLNKVAVVIKMQEEYMHRFGIEGDFKRKL